MDKHSKIKVEVEINKFNAISLFIANVDTLSDEHIKDAVRGALSKFMQEIWEQMVEQGVDMPRFAQEYMEEYARYVDKQVGNLN